MVGASGIEPLTPSMSRKCSTAELSALRATAQHVRGDVLYRQTFGVASERSVPCRISIAARRRPGLEIAPGYGQCTHVAAFHRVQGDGEAFDLVALAPERKRRVRLGVGGIGAKQMLIAIPFLSPCILHDVCAKGQPNVDLVAGPHEYGQDRSPGAALLELDEVVRVAGSRKDAERRSVAWVDLRPHVAVRRQRLLWSRESLNLDASGIVRSKHRGRRKRQRLRQSDMGGQ